MRKTLRRTEKHIKTLPFLGTRVYVAHRRPGVGLVGNAMNGVLCASRDDSEQLEELRDRLEDGIADTEPLTTRIDSHGPLVDKSDDKDEYLESIF